MHAPFAQLRTDGSLILLSEKRTCQLQMQDIREPCGLRSILRPPDHPDMHPTWSGAPGCFAHQRVVSTKGAGRPVVVPRGITTRNTASYTTNTLEKIKFNVVTLIPSTTLSLFKTQSANRQIQTSLPKIKLHRRQCHLRHEGQLRISIAITQHHHAITQRLTASQWPSGRQAGKSTQSQETHPAAKASQPSARKKL